MKSPGMKSPESPSRRNLEPISQLVDGELSQREAEFLIRRVASDDEARSAWQRLHLVRDCLRREFSGPVSLVDRIHEALIEEPSAVSSHRRSGLVRLGIGGAMAAGVAMLAVVGLGNRLAPENELRSVETAAEFVSQSSPLDRYFNAPAVPVGFDPGRRSPELDSGRKNFPEQRFNRYVIRHHQAAGSTGFVSFTPVLTPPARIQTVPAKPDDRDQGTGTRP